MRSSSPTAPPAARPAAPSGEATEAADPVDARVAALERTVAQLEHALAARVSTERAIGVLAERHGISARSAFESLRGDARSQGRPVAELAREVLDGLGDETAADGLRLPRQRSVPAPSQRRPARSTPSSPRRHMRAGAQTVRGCGGRPVLTRPEPLAPPALADRLAALLAAAAVPRPGAAALRVAIDGPEPARPDTLADALAARLPPLGRPAVVVPASGFYRPASLRLEHGRTDPDARYTDWLDAGALAREVAEPAGSRRLGHLPAGAVGPRARPRRPRSGRSRCRRTAYCWCPGRCCRASGCPSTSSSTCGSARRPGGG